MPGAFSLLFRQLAEVWKHFGINQKVSILLALLATAIAIGAILYFSARPDFRLLYSGLTLEDAAHAQEQLEEARIPVQLRDHGQAIYVPAADVYRGRLMLATAGFPKDPSTGFELFEQPKFGLTEFAQQVNFQRALQGEMERTIIMIDGVQAARVLLVMPRDRLFAPDREKAASASIMLTLRRGLSLSQQQVLSIRQLVSTAVPGLVDGHITITDQQGKLLSDSTRSEGSMLGQTPRQQEMRRAIEDELTRKAQDMLDQSIGPGRTIARVSADIDYRRIERHQETFNADGRVVIRESISSEKSSDPVPVAGRDMAQVAVGDPARVSLEQTAGNSRRENVETEYRVPSGRETMIDSGGAISRLSVSVSVARGAQPRDAAALAQIERMVRSAVGLVKTAERQDVIEVLEMDFPAVADSPVDAQWPLLDRIPFDPMSALRVLAGLALILALYLFSRKAVIRLSVEHAPAGVPISQLTGGNARALMGGKPAEEGSDLDHIASLAEQNPSAVATWIDQTVRGSR